MLDEHSKAAQRGESQGMEKRHATPNEVWLETSQTGAVIIVHRDCS